MNSKQQQSEASPKALAPTSVRRGISLVEVVVSTALVAIVLVTSLHTLTSTSAVRTIASEHNHAPDFASRLFAEIMSHRYSDPDGGSTIGAESGESRASFDDVDDYHGLSESPPRDRTGAVIVEASGWTWSAAIYFCDPSTLAHAGTDTGLKRVDITVTGPSGRSFELSGLRGKHGFFETETTAPRTIAGSVEFSATNLQGDNASSAVLLPAYAEAP
ncbi:MAG: prepilin-type N-terminal cleavage/methylation domain-containing protein [Aureliella sp.]